MESVRDRLGWIVENCRNPATGEAWDPSKLSEAAGLSAAHIGMVLRGDIGEPRRPTLTKVARAAGVSLGWLMTGEGSAHPDGAPARVRATPQRPAPAEGSPLERALGQVFDPSQHLPRDIAAVQKALGDESFQFQDGDDAANLDKARAWLDAAAALRRAGTVVTSGSLIDRVTFGKSGRELGLAREAAANAEADARLAADDEIVALSPAEVEEEKELVRKVKAGAKRG